MDSLKWRIKERRKMMLIKMLNALFFLYIAEFFAN